MNRLNRLLTLGLVIAVMACKTSSMMPAAMAQANDACTFITGQVPTAAQWNACFASKQNTLGFTPVRKNGDVMLGLLRFSMTAPSLSGCGTNPSVRGNNQAGAVTMGTGSPTGCLITFAATNPFSATPSCIVIWETKLATMNYSYTSGAISLTQTATSSNIVDYWCAGLQ